MKNTLRLAAAIALVASFHGRTAFAQSVIGQWDGTSTSQQGTNSLSITLDSAAAGWKGSWSTDQFGGGALSDISVKGDTVTFSLAIQSTSIGMQGTLSADHKTMNGYIWIEGNQAGTFKIVKAAPVKPPAPPAIRSRNSAAFR